MNDPTISAKRVRQIGEELWLLARYLKAEQGQIGWVSTCEAWSEQLRLLADHMGRAVAPPGAESPTITIQPNSTGRVEAACSCGRVVAIVIGAERVGASLSRETPEP